jgi:hypothetical protein
MNYWLELNVFHVVLCIYNMFKPFAVIVTYSVLGLTCMLLHLTVNVARDPKLVSLNVYLLKTKYDFKNLKGSDDGV